MLADSNYVVNVFPKLFKEMKEELANKGWILPKLESNMRNQVNITNISFEKCGDSYFEMQSSINHLISASGIAGEINSLVKVKMNDWHNKKHSVLKYCFEIMLKKTAKNIVILYDGSGLFNTIENDLKTAITDRTIVSYPSGCKNTQQSIDNVKNFIAQNNHVLVTRDVHFNGCEATNVIYLKNSNYDIRSALMRGVQNVICVQLLRGHNDIKIKGMKEVNTFYTPSNQLLNQVNQVQSSNALVTESNESQEGARCCVIS
jgi:hypothetical protein